MSNYPNMSYCMFENTNLAMEQITLALQEASSLKDLDLSRSEVRASEELYQACQAYIQMMDSLTDAEGEEYEEYRN